MSMTAQDFIDSLTGNRRQQPVPMKLSLIARENVQIAKSLIVVARKLEREGRDKEAGELRDSIASLLSNNQKLLETTNQTL